MNRHERREKEREEGKQLKKHTKTINKLSSEQYQLVHAMVEEKLAIEKEQLKKEFVLYAGVAMYKSCVEADVCSEAIREMANLINRGNYTLTERELDEMVNNKEAIFNYFNDNRGVRKEVVEAAAFKFPALTKKTIYKYYDEWRKQPIKDAEPEQEQVPDLEQPDLEEIADYIFGDEEDKRANRSAAASAAAARIKEEKQKSLIETAQPKAGLLKVAEVCITLNGEDNVYKLTKSQMKAKLNGADYTINNAQEFNLIVENITAEYNRLIGELKEAYNTWQTVNSN